MWPQSRTPQVFSEREECGYVETCRSRYQAGAGKDTSNYEEILYGYAPHGVALLVKRLLITTCGRRIKSHLTKGMALLVTNGSVSFQFKKMGVFKLKPEGLSIDDRNWN